MTEPVRKERRNPIRRRLHEIIFLAETPAGKFFDEALLVTILISVLAVMLESVESIRVAYGTYLHITEIVITLLFTIEYGLRLWCVRHPLHYARSFFGVIDLLAILPFYLSLIFVGSQSLMVIRAIRLLRIFRIFKLARYVGEVMALMRALRATRHKIMVFFAIVLIIALILGALLYVIEGEESGFTSIPAGFYWAIVTVTTVGYGDIAPQTLLGQIVAAIAMLLGYSLIIIPTGIFALEIARTVRRAPRSEPCPTCAKDGHDGDAVHCKFCGALLHPRQEPHSENKP
jgi:voltage-gated potassium channel